MRTPKLLISLLASLCLVLTAAMPALAAQDEHGHDDSTAESVEHGAGDHEDEHEGPAAHGGGHDHVPTLDDFNWYYGMVGESDVEEPSLLWRPKGVPVPFAALLLNTAVLFYLLSFARKPIAEALKNRKATILRGMDEAAKMKKDAEASLAEYKDKLENIEQEIERVRREMREAGEVERKRILAEAREKRTRMEREARILIEQELKAAREILIRDTVRGALRSAETHLTKTMTSSDQQRMADDYLKGLKQAASGLRGKV